MRNYFAAIFVLVWPATAAAQDNPPATCGILEGALALELGDMAIRYSAVLEGNRRAIDETASDTRSEHIAISNEQRAAAMEHVGRMSDLVSVMSALGCDAKAAAMEFDEDFSIRVQDPRLYQNIWNLDHR